MAYADSQPDVVDWVGYGSFSYNAAFGGRRILDGGTGFIVSLIRPGAQSVHVEITLDWAEG